MRRNNIISREVFKQVKNDYANNPKVSISLLSRKYNSDRKTIRKYIYLIKNNQNLKTKEIEKCKWNDLSDIEEIINKKLSLGARKIDIYNFLKNKFSIKCSYQYFTYYLRETQKKLNLLKASKPVFMYEKLPGTQAQVDWKENFVLYTRNNEKIIFNVLLFKLSFSRKVKLFLTFDRKQDTIIKCLIEAFKEFNGIPKEIVFDNMKTVIYQPNSNNRESYLMNNKFYEFSKDMNFSIYACKVHRPQTKGKVEALAKAIDTLKVYNHEFDNIYDLINIIKNLEDNINSKVNRSTGFTPNYLFIKFELKELIKNNVNQIIFDKYLNKKVIRKVNNNACISYMSNLYSVPTIFINKDLGISVKNDELLIDFNGILVCRHKLLESNIKQQRVYKNTHLHQLCKNSILDSITKENLINSVNETLNVMKLFLKEKQEVKKECKE